ncbi:hypothetical protein [Acetobacter sp. LMG 32666]|uniref:hypothetical protein n=1 Tax=Acetobacter sp. LMG 32666 TaxID=2959295 RepID=UPI0030C7C4C9
MKKQSDTKGMFLNEGRIVFRNGFLATTCFYCREKSPYRSSTVADFIYLHSAAGLSTITITTPNHKANRFFHIPVDACP